MRKAVLAIAVLLCGCTVGCVGSGGNLGRRIELQIGTGFVGDQIVGSENRSFRVADRVHFLCSAYGCGGQHMVLRIVNPSTGESWTLHEDVVPPNGGAFKYSIDAPAISAATQFIARLEVGVESRDVYFTVTPRTPGAPPPENVPRPQTKAFDPSLIDAKFGSDVVPRGGSFQVIDEGKSRFRVGEQFAYLVSVGSDHAGQKIEIMLMDPKHEGYRVLLSDTVPSSAQGTFVSYGKFQVDGQEPVMAIFQVTVGGSSIHRALIIGGSTESTPGAHRDADSGSSQGGSGRAPSQKDFEIVAPHFSLSGKVVAVLPFKGDGVYATAVETCLVRGCFFAEAAMPSGWAYVPGEAYDERTELKDTLAGQIKTELPVVVTRSQLEDVLREQDLEATGLVGASAAMRIGKLAGADLIITGEAEYIAPTERTACAYRVLSCQVVDTKSGQIVYSYDEGVILPTAGTREQAAIASASDLVGRSFLSHLRAK